MNLIDTNNTIYNQKYTIKFFGNFIIRYVESNRYNTIYIIIIRYNGRTHICSLLQNWALLKHACIFDKQHDKLIPTGIGL